MGFLSFRQMSFSLPNQTFDSTLGIVVYPLCCWEAENSARIILKKNE